MRETLLLLLILLSSPLFVYAQEYKVDADIRPRYEYRRGFGQPRPVDDNIDMADNFISQRTRLKFYYKDKEELIEVKFAFQDVRTWGATPTLNNTDNGNLHLYEGWAKFAFGETTALKIGRQELKYDDDRILGNVDWAQQGLVHDAAIFMYDGLFKLHAGGTYQSDRENLFRQPYALSPNYKTLQFLWLNKSFENFKLSLLFLNNGLEQIDTDDPDFTADDLKIRYSQTMGGRAVFSIAVLDVALNGYYQTGQDGSNRDINAYNVMLEVKGKIQGLVDLTLGAELLSGNDDDTAADENEAFNPFYGTNHKFNGFMDYFYVGGRHQGSVGLQDYYAKLGFNIGKNWRVNADYHFFSSMGRQVLNLVGDLSDRSLGQELDLTASFKLYDHVKFDGGFSFLFPQDGIIDLRDLSTGTARDRDKINQWGWVRVIINPTIFSKKGEQN
ncbi:alginate export family protein [Sediminitomix flava]|nr:hypothetical protein [Sediminitomix flava]